MCGLIGAYGEITNDVRNFYRQGLIVDAIRGQHSVGTFFSYIDGSGVAYRSLDAPQDFLCREDVKKEITKFNHRLLMGHNRFATIGEVSTKLAHPFIEGHIVLAHNGTLHNWKGLLGYEPDLGEWSDSRAMAYCIARDGIDDVWWNISGAAAFTYWDNIEKSFNLITNGHRPLFIASANKGRVLLYGSEDWIVEGLAHRNKLPIDVITECEVDVLYTMTMRKKGMVNIAERTLARPKIKFKSYFIGGKGWAGENWRDDWVPSKYEIKTSKNTKELSQNDDGKRCSAIMTEAEFHNRFSECSFCHTSIKGGYHSSFYLHPDMVACLTCSE